VLLPDLLRLKDLSKLYEHVEGSKPPVSLILGFCGEFIVPEFELLVCFLLGDAKAKAPGGGFRALGVLIRGGNIHIFDFLH
jgi:hypothetical protein